VRRGISRITRTAKPDSARPSPREGAFAAF
jgi:hypothetical protein